MRPPHELLLNTIAVIKYHRCRILLCGVDKAAWRIRLALFLSFYLFLLFLFLTFISLPSVLFPIFLYLLFRLCGIIPDSYPLALSFILIPYPLSFILIRDPYA
jgi:uncharacterized BrkB/YihY/UPF0761 family membrane protein